MMNETFATQTLMDWQEKVKESLRGKSIESLHTNTYEGIQLKPLYTNADIDSEQVSQFPGQRDFRRGMNSLGYLTQEWRIAQSIDAKDGEDLKEKLLDALEKGQTALAFSVDDLSLNEFNQLIDGLYSKYPFCIDAKGKHMELLTAVLKLPKNRTISGYIASDPLSEAVLMGGTLDTAVSNEWTDVLHEINNSMPHLRTILVNTSIYHHAGANAVQELAIALSTGVYYIDILLKLGMKLEAILQSFVFKFSVGSNFFMEIAKLRAARILWAKIAESYGAQTKDQIMIITADTSAFTKTVYDPYVNLLRAGNEALAAVIGGVQYIHVSPFNEPEGNSTAFSERIARNIQLILKKEAHLQKIVDPAGGSWYIESLTNELAEKSWGLFLEIDERDGIIQALQTGWIQEKISEVLSKREEDTFNRKKSMIGTNMYANLDDRPLSVLKNKVKATTALPQVRLSEPFERLRTLSEELNKLGRTPTVGLICLGDLKEYKPRMDFITGLFATGGIHSENSESIGNADSALRFVKESGLQHFVLCGADKQYEEMAVEIILAITENLPNMKVSLAGIPKNREQLEQAGVREFIHLRSNCYELLSTLLSEMEGKNHE